MLGGAQRMLYPQVFIRGVPVVLLASLLTLAACTASIRADQNLVPVSAPEQRLTFPEVSLLPPRGEDWFINKSRAVQNPEISTIVQFVKSSRRRQPPATDPTQALTIEAHVWRVDVRGPVESQAALQQLVRHETETLGLRWRLLTSEVEPDNSRDAMCVRYRYTAEDSQVPRFPGSTFVLKIAGVRCVPPNQLGYLIDAAYSQRHLKGQPDADVEAEGEVFLRGIVMLTPPRLAGANTSPDRRIVPGERIGQWTLDMTISQIDDVISGSPTRSSGVADPRPGPDFRSGFVTVLWPGRSVGAGTNDTATGKAVCLIVWSPEFQTLEGVGPGSDHQAVIKSYGTPLTLTTAGPESSRLIYDGVGMAFVVKRAVVQQIYIFRPGDAKRIWKF